MSGAEELNKTEPLKEVDDTPISTPVKPEEVEKVIADHKVDAWVPPPPIPTFFEAHPFGVLAALLVIFVIVVAGAHPNPLQGSPKAVVFVLSGVRGTSFDNLVYTKQLAPNLAQLTADGVSAKCVAAGDEKCAKNAPTDFVATRTSGLTSLLTGVSPAAHQVTNSSTMVHFATTSDAYPTFVQQVRGSFVTAAVGGARLLSSPAAGSNKCDGMGVLDFECGMGGPTQCAKHETCNLNGRYAFPSSARDAENTVDAVMKAVENDGADLVVANIGSIGATGDDSSTPAYGGAFYEVDAAIGLVLAKLRARAGENWLVVVTSDNGSDNTVPFVVAAYNGKSVVGLSDLTAAVSQQDVAPTVLKWFDIEAASTTEGVVQGVCTPANALKDCEAFHAEQRRYGTPEPVVETAAPTEEPSSGSESGSESD